MKNLTFGILIALLLISGRAGAQCVTAGTDQTICENTSTAPLGGTFGGDATGAIWTSNSGGTFSNNASGSTPEAVVWTPPVSFSGSAILTLTAEGGTCAGTSVTETITVNPNVTASVSISAMPSGAICAGTSVTFTAIAVNGGTPSFQWKVNGADAGTNSLNFTSATLANNDIVTVVMTSDMTCVTGSPATSNPVTMAVTNPVAASVSIAASPSGPVCSGTLVTFTATPGNGGTPPSYQWKVNGSNTGSNSPTFASSTLANNSIVTVEMTSTETCVSGSPAISNAITMNVTATLPASVSIAASPSGTICAGTSVTFTATPVNGGTPSYQWRINGGNVGSNSATFTSTTLANNDIVTVIMTSTANCASGSPYTSNQVIMSVTAPGSASVSIAASPSGTVCSGTPVTFTATTLNGGTASYQWKVNSVNTGTNNPVFSSSTLSDNDIVTVVMTSSLMCVTGSPATSNQVIMNINPIVTASVSIVAVPAGTVCSGIPVTFTATPFNGGTPSYQWKVNGVNAGTNSASFISSALADNDVVTVVMTSTAPCVSGSPATSNALTMNITPSVPASVSIAAVPAGAVCAGTSVTFTATPVNGATPAYQWRVNGINAGTNSPTFTSTTLANNDIVTVVMTSGITCTTGSPATSNPVTMIVNPLPLPTLTSSEPDNIICAGTSVTFTAGGGESYNFIVGGVSRQNGTSPTFVTNALTNGQRVTVAVTNSSFCSATFPVGLQFFVNPAPFISMYSVSTCSADLTTYAFSVIVSSGTVTSTAGTVTLTGSNVWRISEIPAGVAVTVKVTSAGGCEDILEVTAPNCSCPDVPAAVSGGDKTYCEGATIPAINATVLSGGTIDWYSASSGGVLLASGVLTYTPVAAGTYYALARNSTTNCISSTRTAVSVTANQAPVPTLTSSDPDNAFCAGTNVIFTAGGGTSFNFIVAGVSVQNGASTTYASNSLTNGQIVSVIVSSSLGCTANSAAITNTVHALPLATLTSSEPDNSFCAGTSIVFTAGGGTHYNFRVGGLSVQNGVASTYTTTSLTNGQIVDVIVSNANNCTSTSAGITNSVSLPPTVGAGTGGNNCGLNFHLNGTMSTGTGTWTKESGPGNATFTPDANAFNATVGVSAYGNYTFKWTVVNGECTASANISILFIQQSAASAGRGGDECDRDYIFNALPITTGVGTWTKVSGPGIPVFTPDDHQPNATVTVDLAGTYDFAWTVVNSTCTSSDIIRVGFHDLPPVAAGRDTAMCKGGSIQLQAVASGTVLWSPIAHVSNPNIINPVMTPDVTTTYTLNLTDQYGCNNSDDIIIGVRDNPVADAGPDQTLVYQFATTMDASPPGESETGVWSVNSGSGILSDINYAKTSVDNLSSGVNQFVWNVSNGFCPLSSDTANIYVNEFVIPTLITPNMDGRNDYFVISGLLTLGKTELIIFDRKGARVYDNADYDNSWDGVNFNNNPLPDDTYFYSMKTESGRTFKGYIVIKR